MTEQEDAAQPTPKATELRRRLWELLDDEEMDGATLRDRIKELLKEGLPHDKEETEN